ncbi:MAG: hypothetical protein RJA59_264, partial [Pseudomonadota bacterium]
WVCLGFWFGDDIERAARAGSKFGSYILGGVVVVVVLLLGRAWLRRRRASAAAAAAGGERDGDPPG